MIAKIITTLLIILTGGCTIYNFINGNQIEQFVPLLMLILIMTNAILYLKDK